MSADDSLPDDVEMLKRLVHAGAADLARARAEASSAAALIAHLKLQIEKLKRELYGPRSERTARLLDQLELKLEELESAATEDEIAAEQAAASAGDTIPVRPFTRKSLRASHSRRICRASGLLCRVRPPAFAAAAGGCASWAKMLPRRWKAA